MWSLHRYSSWGMSLIYNIKEIIFLIILYLSFVILFHQPFKSFNPFVWRKKSGTFLFLGALPETPALRSMAVPRDAWASRGRLDQKTAPGEPGFSFAASPADLEACGSFLDLFSYPEVEALLQTSLFLAINNPWFHRVQGLQLHLWIKIT